MDYFCQFFLHGYKSRPGIVPAEFFCQFLFREKSPSGEKKSLVGRKLALIAGLKCVDADRPSLGESTSKPNPPPPGKNGQNIFLLLFLFQTLCIILRSWSFKDFPCWRILWKWGLMGARGRYWSRMIACCVLHRPKLLFLLAKRVIFHPG